MYKVMLQKKELPDDYVINQTSEMFIDFEQLKSDEDFLFFVAACTEAGCGPWSESTEVKRVIPGKCCLMNKGTFTRNFSTIAVQSFFIPTNI